MSNAAINAVKRAMVLACAKQGITEFNAIQDTCQYAVDGIGPQTYPAYKAWKTMDKTGISCRTRR